MKIAEIIFRNRNDFHFIAECSCGHKSRHGDGYADHFYQTQVFPARHCERCGLNEYGETREATELRYAAKERERQGASS